MKTKTPVFYTACMRIAAVLAATCLIAAAPSTGRAYVLPAEQVVQFMLQNFSKFQAVDFTQTVRAFPSSEGDSEAPALKEEVRAQAGGSVNVRPLPPVPPAETEGEGQAGHEADWTASAWARSDRAFLRLLMSARPARILDLLREWGIAEGSVSYTRQDGAVAFRIGERVPGRPVLIVEKERFLPMLLRYRPVPGEESATATVRFVGYRAVPDGWFPCEMLVTTDQGHSYRCSLQRLAINGAPVTPGLHERKRGPSVAAEDPD